MQGPGRYTITFNSNTGYYRFVLTPDIGIIGNATPGGWDSDTDLMQDAENPALWNGNLTLANGEVKFRADDYWATYWGAVDFPTGTGTQDGRSIPITAGTYSATINTATGEYTFSLLSNTVDLLKPDAVSLSPNPAKDLLDIRFNAEAMWRDVQIIIFNQLGARVKTLHLNVRDRAQIDVSDLSSGNYLVHVSSGKFVVGKKLVIVK